MTWQTLKNRLCHRPNNAALLATMNLVANALERWLDRNSAKWLHHIMLAVNCIVVASVVLREVRRSTSGPSVERTGSGEKKECLVDGGEE